MALLGLARALEADAQSSTLRALPLEQPDRLDLVLPMVLWLNHGLPRRSHHLDRVVALPVFELRAKRDRVVLLVGVRIGVRVGLERARVGRIWRPPWLLALGSLVDSSGVRHGLVARRVQACRRVLRFLVLRTPVDEVVPCRVLACLVPIVAAAPWSCWVAQVLLVLLRMIKLLGLLHVVVAAVLSVQPRTSVHRGVGCGLQLLAGLGTRMKQRRPVLAGLVANIGVGLIHQGIVREVRVLHVWNEMLTVLADP